MTDQTHGQIQGGDRYLIPSTQFVFTHCSRPCTNNPIIRLKTLSSSIDRKSSKFVYIASCNPGRTIRPGNGWFRTIPEISWKQYSGERIRWQDLSGSARSRQEPGKTGSRIRSPDSCIEFLAFPGGFWPETVRFLQVSAGNSRNTASGIIDLGMPSPIYDLQNKKKR
jgi:hypothetical protein